MCSRPLAVSELLAAFAVMGILKQLMIFGKPGLQGLPTRVALFLWAFSRQGATGVPIHNMGFGSRLGESPNTWKHFGPELTQEQYSVLL